MEFREYQPTDREACLQILRSNVPEYFYESDLADFERFLDHLPGPFFVVTGPQAIIIACGGIARGKTGPTEAVLCYGMVNGARLRQGVGKELLRKRLEVFLPLQPQIERITVNTTQKIEGFFEKFGFCVAEREPDGFGPGLDRVYLVAAKDDLLQRLDKNA